MKSSALALALAVTLLAVTSRRALAQPHCENYSFKTSDVEVDAPLDHSEIASINVGDRRQISDVFATTKLLVRQFNGVKLSLDVVSPADGQPPKTVVMKNELRNNPNFLLDHLKPLKLKIIWRDDAPLTLGQAVSKLPQKEIRRSKQEFVEVTARPDTSLRQLVRGISTNAGSGGSRGTWELRVENKSFKKRPHVKLMNWDLTLCFDQSEAMANESHDTGLHDPLVVGTQAAISASQDQSEEDDVVFRRTFGAPGRLGAGLPAFGRIQPLAQRAPRRPLFGSSGLGLGGGAAAGAGTRGGGIFGRLGPQTLMPQPTQRQGGFRLFRLFRRDGN